MHQFFLRLYSPPPHLFISWFPRRRESRRKDGNGRGGCRV